MKQTQLIMGMPITIEVVSDRASEDLFKTVFDYFRRVDAQFSTYKPQSEISRFNRAEITANQLSPEMKQIFEMAEETKQISHGYFEIKRPNGLIDPSGIVKGYAIYQASQLIEKKGFTNYFVDAGGDIQVCGHNAQNNPWSIGIRNPENRHQNVKIISIGDRGVATSGTAIRGQHIYDPFAAASPITEILSLTVVGPNVYEADRFATAAFALREKGIPFILSLPGFEAYAITSKGTALFTPGFETYVV